MAEVIRMPKMSDTMEEGVIAAWHKKVGDKIESGDVLAEVETDKATMELESFQDGVLLHIGIEEKSTVPVDGVIAILGEEGEDISALIKEIESGSETSEDAKEKAPTEEATDQAPANDIDTSNIKANVITMPKMSDTMEEGTIAAWHKSVGDKVESGDVMAEVETDKATMELESYEDGTLLYIGVEAGSSVEVDGIIAIVGQEGADWETLLKAHKSKGSKKSDKPAKKESKPSTADAGSAEPDKHDAPSTTNGGRIKASPLAKKLASDKGVDLAQVDGTGENGRIIKRDIENFDPSKAQSQADQQATAPAGSAPPLPAGQEGYTEQPVSQMRKVISKRLAESKFTSPHFYVTVEVNMDKAIEARKSINEYIEGKVSFNDLVIKASAAALRKHPTINSAWLGNSIRTYQHVHIGMAVAIPDGLLVPVIRFADQLSLSQISGEAKRLGKMAKDRTLQPSDWEGNTFTISNLGMFGVEEFTAIINPPDSSILAVGGIQQKPIVKNGAVVPGNVMKLTLSCDHRVVDGAQAAQFLNTLKAYLEDPVRILA